MLIRSRAPLRLGLAGGGTDVSPYSDLYGGAILNATISMYAYATIKPTNDNVIKLNAIDREEIIHYSATDYLEIDGQLDLLKRYLQQDCKRIYTKAIILELTTYVDAPPGSGLGSSSTLVVAILEHLLSGFSFLLESTILLIWHMR